MLRVLYLVHDLSDPAVRRRVLMLKAGGAEVMLAGFRRGAEPFGELGGIVPIEFGVTHDGRFAHRLAATARTALTLRAKLRGIPKPDVIIGRTLEMLALANGANSIFSGAVPIVYECLDVHRLMLRQDGLGKAMRAAERTLAGKTSLLITSSPAFIREYFQPYGQIHAPILLLQNKVFEIAGPSGGEPVAPSAPAEGEPWRIGWFGALRCRKSLELLSAFTRRMEGRFEVVLRGRPALSEFRDFTRTVAEEPYISFWGAYRNPEDLAAIYGQVQLTWAIDFFEEGLNSDWLLPNRLYEGCRYGAVPIAMRQTETGRFLADRQLGFLLREATPEALAALIGDLDRETFAAKQAKVAGEDRSTWICDLNDCRALVDRLRRLTAAVEQGGHFIEAVA